METRDPSPRSPLPLTRREALAALAAAGGYALSATPIPAQAIKTDSQGLVEGTVQVAGADQKPIPVYEAYPSKEGEFPVVVVISEVWGIHEYIKDVTRRFAKEGYYAVAPELFSREGVNLAAETDVQKVLGVVFNAPIERIVGDVRATADYARKQPAARGERAGVTGFCWGGGITLIVPAFYKDTSAAVAWYGPPKRVQKGDKPVAALDVAAEVPCPVLLLYGGADQGIPSADIDAEEAALKAVGRTVEKHVYPGVGHAFFADYRPSYNADAAKDGWARCLDWFQKYLKA